MAMNRNELIAAFEMGDLGRVEFFELALEAGLELAEINKIMEEADSEL